MGVRDGWRDRSDELDDEEGRRARRPAPGKVASTSLIGNAVPPRYDVSPGKRTLSMGLGGSGQSEAGVGPELGAGGSLPHRDVLETAFGRDLSGIQAHSDPAAMQSASAIGAAAYATGDHVVAAPDAGLFTLAHEVTHVLQQRDGLHALGGFGVSDVYERQADDVAAAVVRGESVADRFGRGGGAAPSGLIQRKEASAAQTAAAAAESLELVEKRQKLLAALPSVTSRWQVLGGGLFSQTDTPAAPLPPALFLQAAYGLMLQDQVDLAPVKEALEGPNREPYAAAFAEAYASFRADRPRLDAIKRDVDDLVAGGSVAFNANRIMASQALLTGPGKRALQSAPSLGTGPLQEYASASAASHGELEGPGLGAARVKGCVAILATMRTGAPFVAEQAAAAPTEKAPPTPEVQAKVDALRAAIAKAVASAGKAEGGRLADGELASFTVAIEIAGPEARDIVWADRAVVIQLAQVLDAAQSGGVIGALDPVERLYKECVAAVGADEDQDAVRRVDASNLPAEYRSQMRERIKLKVGGGVYQAIRAWLLAHAGDEKLRRRLLEHTKLKDDFIDRLDPANQRVVYRIIIRGSEAQTPEDVIIEGAERGDGPDVIRGLRALADSNPVRLRALEGDMVFRRAIERMTQAVPVDEQMIVPYHLCLAMWGRPVSAAGDTATARPGEVDPTGEDRPLTVPERMQLKRELFDACIGELHAEISKPLAFRGGQVKGADPQVVMDTLVKYDRLAAQDPHKTLLQREKLVFGRTLEEKYFEAHQQALRTWIYEHSGPNNRSGANRVLGTEQGSTVGMFNGQMMLAGEGQVAGKMSLQQALRETVYDGKPIYEHASVESRAISRAVDDESKGGVLEHWRAFKIAVEAVDQDITKATDIPIRAIDLIRNAYMEHAGHLETRLAVKFKDPALSEIRAEMGLTADVDRAAGAPPAGIEEQAEQRYGAMARALWGGIQMLGPYSPHSMYVAARAILDLGATLPRLDQVAPPSPGAPAPTPATVAIGHDVEERPPRSFAGYYRLQYGVSPKLHAAAVIRAMPAERAVTPIEAAKLMGLEEGLVTERPEAEKADDGTIGPHNRHLVRGSFTEETARANAKQMWTILHVSDGKLSLIEAELYGPYNDEEQRLIRVAFRRLSGGFDLQFYLRQAMETQKRIRASDDVPEIARGELSKHQEFAVGAEGSKEGEISFGGGTVLTHGSESELERALAVSTTGTIDARTRLWNATKRGEDGQVIAIIDELTDDERRTILRDGALIDAMERLLSQYNYERAFKVLTGQGDLADRLYSRSHGGSWSERKITGGTDETGMRNDIKSYGRRLRLQYDREVRKELGERFKPGDLMPPPELIEREVNRRVKEACFGLLSDKDVTAIMKSELDDDEYAELRSMIVNAGDARDWAVAGGGGKDKILAEIRGMSAAERQAKLEDPGYMRLLGERLTSEKDYRDAMNALKASADGVSEGSGGLAALDEKSRGAGEVEGGKRDPRETLRTLAALSAAEYMRLQEEPALMAQLMASLQDDQQRRLARETLAFRFPDLSATPEAERGAAVEKAQIDYLVHQSVARLRLACRTSNKWSNVLEASIEVYKAPLPAPTKPVDPKAKPDPKQPAGEQRDLRADIWTQVSPDVEAFAVDHDAHRGAVTTDDIDGATMKGAIHAAVLRQEDPSDWLIKAKIWTVDEQLGKGKDGGEVMAGITARQLADHKYKEEDLVQTLQNASDEHVASKWTSVKAPPAGGGKTMEDEYKEYRAAFVKAKPAIEARAMADEEAEKQAQQAQVVEEIQAAPATAKAAEGAPGAAGADQVQQPVVEKPPLTAGWNKQLHTLGAANDPAIDEAELQRRQFLEFAIHVSASLEDMLIRFMGDDREVSGPADPNAAKTRVSDNKRYNNLKEVIYGRIPHLKPEVIANALGMAPEDRWLLMTAARSEIGLFTMRKEKNLRSRGAQTSERGTASAEKEELDTSRILYGRAMSVAMTDGDVNAGERANLQYLGDQNDQARDAYKTALETAAMWASLIVGTLVTIVATVLTGGLALGPVSMIALGAATAALSGTAKAMVNKEILDDEWDSKDSADLIAREVITGVVTMGTTFFAQKLLAAAGSVGSLARQAGAVRGVLGKPPPLWRVFLNEASEEVTSEMMSGVVEAGLEATDPLHWIDGYREGAKEAKEAGLARLAKAPGDALRGGVTALLTAGVGRVMKRGGKGGHGPDLGDMNAQQKRVSLTRNIKKVFGDPEEKVAGALVEWAMNQGDPIDWSKAPGELLQGVISEYNEVGHEMHSGTAHEHGRKRDVEKHLKIFGTDLSAGERTAFREMNGRAMETDSFITVREYTQARTQVAMTGLSTWEAHHAPLSPAQRDAFVRWVREAGSADELSQRAKADPTTVPAVRQAAATEAADAARETPIPERPTVRGQAVDPSQLPPSQRTTEKYQVVDPTTELPPSQRKTQEMEQVDPSQLPPSQRTTQQVQVVDPSQRTTQKMDRVDPTTATQQTDAPMRDLGSDFGALHEGSVPEDALGAHQKRQAAAALARMPQGEYQAMQALVSSMPTATGQGFLLKAVAAGHSTAEVQWLAGHMMGRDDGWLLDNLTLHDPRGNGTGLTQQHSMSCNSAMTMTMQGAYDPIFALGLRIANPNISQVNDQAPDQFNADLTAREKSMLESPYQGQNALGAQGRGGQAMPRAHQGPAAGRWADDLLNNMLGRFGMTFGTEVGMDGADAVRSLDEGLLAGMHVPVVIGASAQNHAHYVMATGRRDGAGGVEYRFHNTANGQSVWVPAWQILSNTMPLLGGQQITAIERPRPVGPFSAAGGVPMAGGGQPLTQAAAPQLANLAMSAVTQTIPISVASTAITVQASDTAQPQTQQGPQEADQAQQAPSDRTKQAASAPTLRIPLEVQQAVAEIVHPRAVAALNSLEAPKEPGTAHSKDEADRQKFTAQLKNRQVDLAAFKATYDMEYEDAVEKLGRAKADPAVAAVLNQVPEEELVAIILYMSTHYVEMNRTLRERDENSLGDVGDAIALADRGLEKLPSYQGWCSRGVDSSNAAEIAARYVPGQMVTEDGFTSTSSAEGAQYKGNVQFRIKSENGRQVQSFSRYEKEKEVLFRPGSRFLVTEKERDGDTIIITMEEVAGGGGPGGAPGGPGGTVDNKDANGGAKQTVDQGDQTKVEAKVEPQVDATPETKPDATPETKPQIQVDATPETKPQTQVTTQVTTGSQTPVVQAKPQIEIPPVDLANLHQRVDAHVDAILKGVKDAPAEVTDRLTQAGRVAAEETYRAKRALNMDAAKARKQAGDAAKKVIRELSVREAEALAVARADKAIADGTAFDADKLPEDTKTQLAAFNAGTSGQAARRLAPHLAGKDVPTMESILDGEVQAGYATKTTQNIMDPEHPTDPTKTQRQLVYEFADGTVIRIKPKGDIHNVVNGVTRPTFSIEVRKVAPSDILPGQNGIAFKVDARGHAVPKGPFEVENPYESGKYQVQHEAFAQAVLGAGHQRAKQ